jgi:hypothetical protein
MRTYARTVLAVAAATVLGLATATAGAATMRVSPAGNFTIASLGAVTLAGTGLGGTRVSITCNMTFSGTLASSFTAAEGTAMGRVTNMVFPFCTGGTYRQGLTLPWPVTFTGLTATGIDGAIRNVTMQFDITIFGIAFACLYGGDLPFLIEVASSRTGLMTLLANSMAKRSGHEACPPTLSWSGTFSLTQQTIALA